MAIQLISSDGSIITQQIGSCEWDLTIQVDTENNLVYGGVVTWLQDYDFYVSPAGYYLNNTFYESPEAFITLAPADPVLDRFDVIYVDADQVVKVLQGTPSITASQPGLDLGTQLGLGVIFVQAASTQPGTANEECGYIDNAEWTASASDGSIDIASTNTPCSGTVSIEGTTVTTGDYFKLTRASAFALSPDFNNVHFVIRSKGAWGNRKLNIRWYNGGLPVGNTVAFGHGNTYNFASNNIVDCQLITLNASDFALPISQVVDEIRFTMSGNNNIGFFIDNICIQNNGSIVLPSDNDIHNQYFGPQTPGDWWIAGNNRTHGWITSPDILTGGDGSEKFGWGSRVTGSTGTAIGWAAQANGQEGATAVGNQSVANVGVAIGFGALSTRGVAVGGGSSASGGTAVGWGATNTALSGTAIGGGAQTLNYFSSGAIALGYGAYVDSSYGGISIGSGAGVGGHSFSAALGVFARTTAARQIVIGGGHDLYSDYGMDSLYFGGGVTSPWVSDRFWSVTGAEGTDIDGTSWFIAGAKGTGDGDSGGIYLQTADRGSTGTTLQSLTTKVGLNSNTLGFYLDNTRLQMDEGTDVVATGDLTLGTGNIFSVTGNTTINAITSTNWQDGALIYLVFTGIPTLKHDTIGGAGTSRMRLAGAIDFDVTANTVLALVLKDGYWREVGRTQAIGGGSGILSADNALTLSTPSNVQWGSTTNVGSPLLHTTYINTGGFLTNWAGANVGTNLVNFNNTGAGGGGMQVNSISTAITGVAVSSDAIVGISTSGKGMYAQSTTGVGAMVFILPATTSTIAPVLQVSRSSSGTAADGIGGSIEFYNKTSGVAGQPFSNSIVSKWTTSDNATRTSQLILRGVDSTATSDLFTLSGNGSTRLNKYGVGSFPDTPAYALGVDASGNVIEFTPGVGGGGFLTADNGLTASSATNVQLGAATQGNFSPLLHDTYINTTANYTLHIIGSIDQSTGFGSVLRVNNTNTNGYAALYADAPGFTPAIVAQAVNGYGIQATSNSEGVIGTGGSAGIHGESSGGIALWGRSTTGIGLQAQSTSGFSGIFHVLPATTNSVHESIRISRGSSGIAANGIGESITFYVSPNTGLSNENQYLTNSIISKWTDATFATRTSQLVITGVNSAVTADLFTLSGNGALKLNKYGIGTFTGTPAYSLQVDASGNIIEGSLAGGSGFVTADNGLTASTATNVQLGSTTALGSPLLHVTYINTSTFALQVNGANVFGAAMNVSNTGDGVTIGSSAAGYGATISSVTGKAANFYITPATTNTVATVLEVLRASSGTTSDGVGGSIDFLNEADNGNNYVTNQIVSKLPTSAFATRTSQLDITGVNSAATGTIASFYGSGVVGIGIATGYTGTRLEVVDNSFGAGTMALFTSASTGTALNGEHILVSTTTTGANVNSGVTNYGFKASITNTGTGAINYGVYGVATGSSSVGVFGSCATGTGVYGFTSAGSQALLGVNQGSGSGLRATSGSGLGISVLSTSGTGASIQSITGQAAHFQQSSAGTNDIDVVVDITRGGNGNAAAGFGASLEFRLETSPGFGSGVSTALVSKWVDPAVATATSQFDLIGLNSAVSNTIMSAYGTGVVGIGISSSYVTDRLDVVNATNQNHTARISTTSNTSTSDGLYSLYNTATQNVDSSAVFASSFSYGTNINSYGIVLSASKSVSGAALASATNNTLILSASTTSTLTVNPATTIRTVSGQINQVIVRNNAAAISPIVTHVSGMHVLPITYEAGTGQVAITNYYGALIGDSTGGGAVITNPYGVYQEGVSDVNYFAGKTGIGAAPATCAKLEVASTTQGLLLPRMTKTQRDAISTPLAGLAVYQTDNTPGLRVYNGTNWMRYTETTD